MRVLNLICLAFAAALIPAPATAQDAPASVIIVPPLATPDIATRRYTA